MVTDAEILVTVQIPDRYKAATAILDMERETKTHIHMLSMSCKQLVFDLLGQPSYTKPLSLFLFNSTRSDFYDLHEDTDTKLPDRKRLIASLYDGMRNEEAIVLVQDTIQNKVEVEVVKSVDAVLSLEVDPLGLSRTEFQSRILEALPDIKIVSIEDDSDIPEPLIVDSAQA